MSSAIQSAAVLLQQVVRLKLPLRLRTEAITKHFSVHARSLPDSFPSLTTVAEVTAAAELLYTSAFVASPSTPSISHVTSLYSSPATGTSSPSLPVSHVLHTLRVDAHAPRSSYDWFALNFSRARADLIVLTGAILRDEPLLTGNVLAEYKPVLDQWRRAVWGRQCPPAVCVLTAGPVDFNHPVFASTEGDLSVYTTSQYFHTLHHGLQAHSRLRPQLCSASSSQQMTIPLRRLQALIQHQPSAISSVSSDRPIRILSPYTAPSLHTLLQHFRATHTNISVECGPTTTLPHYYRHHNQRIDTLLLSVYSGQLGAGGVNERCVIPGREVWEGLGWAGSGGGGSGGGGAAGVGGVGDVGFALTTEWVDKYYDCLSVARQGDWRFEWHRSKHQSR